MIMVDVEAAQRRWFPRMLQLSPGVPVFAAAPCPQAQPAVVPKLAFRTETMRCLNERDQKGDADREIARKSVESKRLSNWRP